MNIGEFVSIADNNPVENVQTLSDTLQIDGGTGKDTPVNRLYQDALNDLGVTINDPNGETDVQCYIVFARFLSVTTGNQNDSVSMGYITTSQVTATLTNGGDDLLSYYASHSIGRVSMVAGDGDDFFALDINKYDGDTFVDTGSGSDTILFARSVSDESVNPGMFAILYTGDGADQVLIGKHYAVVNNLPVLQTGGNNFNVMHINLGTGNDGGEITGNVINNLYVYMGAGEIRRYSKGM